MCDLTVGVCDANCCCDMECTAEYRDSVRDTGSCAVEGPDMTVQRT